MDARGEWRVGHETHLEDGRGHAVTVDLPTDEGGNDAGTSALELTLLSLAGCISTIFTLIAEKRRLNFDGLTVTLKGDRPAGAPTVQRVHGQLELRTSASKEAAETVLRLTLKTCPVGVLFERARIPVDVTLVIVPPTLRSSHPATEPTSPEPT